jgi:hypothetical protein
MNSNQRSEANNQSNNGGNEMDVSSSRAGTVDRNNMNQSQQSGTLNGGATQQGSEQSTDRTGSQTDTSAQRQGMPQERQSNDVAGGMPKSPRGNRQSADEKMDDDTGLSNTANREPSELDQNLRQERQSNVGRRDDGTPD